MQVRIECVAGQGGNHRNAMTGEGCVKLLFRHLDAFEQVPASF